MRIIHVEDYFDPEAGYQINELLRTNRNNKDEIILITSNDMTPFHKKVDPYKDNKFEKEFNVRIIRLKVIFKISQRILMKDLFKTIEKLKPQAVFLHGIGDFKDIVLYKKKKKYVIVRDCHMSWSGSHNRYKNLYFKFFKTFFSSIINNTDKYKCIFSLGLEESEYLDKLGISESKIEELPHGYSANTVFYSEEYRASYRKKYKVSEEQKLVSYIGKFNDYKKPHLLLEMLDNIDDESLKKNTKVLFMGTKDDEYMKTFNLILSNYSFKENVILEDSKPFDQLYKYYSATDICVFPKETSLSSIHAQVCGNEVIMEKEKSNIERVINSSNLYDKNDIEEASEILKRLLLLPNSRNIPTQLQSREYKIQSMFLRKLLHTKKG